MKQHLVERMLYTILGLVFLATGLLTVLQIQSSQRLEEQNKVLKDQVNGQKELLTGVQTLLKNQGKTTEDINKSLSCILVFFSTPNRAEYYISDLSNCTITSLKTGQTQILSVPNTSIQSQPNPSPQAVPIQEKPTPAQSPPKSTLQSTIDNLDKGVTNLVYGLTHK